MRALVIQVDDSRFPLVVVRFVGPNTDEEFRSYLQAMDRLLEDSRGFYGLLYDATEARMPSGRQSRMQTAWMEANEDAIRRSSVGTAFVISSVAIRGVLRAILMMQSMSTPYRVEATVAAAEAWLRDCLSAARSQRL